MHLLRSGLAALLDDEEDIGVVETVDRGEKVVPVGRDVLPDVALLAADLPGADGFAVAAQLREQLPSCATVIMAARRRPGDLRGRWRPAPPASSSRTARPTS
jgi:two-component system response regulator DesR